MRIYTKEPVRVPTKVIIEMTDMEACELRDFMGLDGIGKRTQPAVYKFFSLIHDLTKDW